jgi:hypothetical protein
MDRTLRDHVFVFGIESGRLGQMKRIRNGPPDSVPQKNAFAEGLRRPASSDGPRKSRFESLRRSSPFSPSSQGQYSSSSVCAFWLSRIEVRMELSAKTELLRTVWHSQTNLRSHCSQSELIRASSIHILTFRAHCPKQACESWLANSGRGFHDLKRRRHFEEQRVYSKSVPKNSTPRNDRKLPLL